MFNISIMNDLKSSRFKSYIDGSCDLDDISLSDEQHTKLLEGEVIIRETSKVLMYTSISDPDRAKRGVLTVTNFKLSFIPDKDDDDVYYQQNYLLGPYEICLSAIDVVYQMGDKTKKKLTLGQNVNGKIKELLIVCKNMRTFHFSLKYVDREISRHITNAILYHVAPKRLSLLFAFDYKDNCEDRQIKESQVFKTRDDWRRELERTKCSANWRICSVNENYEMYSLPRYFVVPAKAEDGVLLKAARHFRDRNCPVWVWGTKDNAALVRMAELEPTISDRTQENIMLENIRKTHSSLLAPEIFELGKFLPLPKELQQSFIKLREICTPDTKRLFKTQDSKFYSLLESCRWLSYVSMCLEQAKLAAECLLLKKTVVLQEGSGRDLNPVISSLVQLILDPHYRSYHGFQILVQKEWVILGHPFRNRLGLLEDDQNEPAPYFLLFLDCVWQLQKQFPTAFQIGETYLTTLWDSVHITIFDTFVFNCELDRSKGKKNLSSVWDWTKQFSDRDTQFFGNPLYDDSSKKALTSLKTRVSSLDLWRQCYLRWLPGIEIIRGGQPQIDLATRAIVAEICDLSKGNPTADVNLRRPNTKDEILSLMQKVNSFYPFSRPTNDMLPDNDLVSMDGLDSQSILNLTNE